MRLLMRGRGGIQAVYTTKLTSIKVTTKPSEPL